MPSHPADPEAGARAVRLATWLSIGTAVTLVLLKMFGWAASGSVALLASLLDSGLDLVASLAVFFAVRWAARPPDWDHRHGHGKAEAFAGLLQAGLVLGSGLFVAWEAVRRILSPQPVANGAWAVAIMAISILVTLGLVWFQTRAIARSGSVAIKGDRAHYTVDLVSNLVALIGVGSATYLTAAPLDAVAGLIVAVWLLWGASSVLRESADQLLDRELPQETQAAITAAVLADSRIGGVHRLRTRVSGSVPMIQMHVDLDPDLTLAEAHDLLELAEARVRDTLPGADILIHPDPRRVGADPVTE
ncbi:MAG: cation transporter [Caulobacterales bacterium]|nr:cation transporter [Caulobacterales bacterium]